MAKTALLRRLSDVDFRLLRVFRSVVSCGGVSAAELELNIGRSTISRHLTDLEIRLGCKLCQRGPGGFSLTEEGEHIYTAALQLFSAIHEFQAKVDETNKDLTGNLAIAYFDKGATNSSARLPQAIHAFERVAPKVDIEVHVEPINIVETGVLNGQFQLGIVPMHKKSTNLDYHRLYYESMFLYCGKEHPFFDEPDRKVRRADVQKHKYAGFAFHSPNMMASHDWKLKRRATVNNEEALATLVLSGCYLGFLPDHFAQHFIDRGEMRALRPDVYTYRSDHYAIVRKAPKAPKRVERFLDCLGSAHGL